MLTALTASDHLSCIDLWTETSWISLTAPLFAQLLPALAVSVLAITVTAPDMALIASSWLCQPLPGSDSRCPALTAAARLCHPPPRLFQPPHGSDYRRYGSDCRRYGFALHGYGSVVNSHGSDGSATALTTQPQTRV